MHQDLIACALLTAFAATATADVRPKLFVERDGVVAMEAEHATRLKGWKPVARPDASGVALADEGGRLEFVIQFKRPGRYYVWFRHAKPQNATDNSNDCVVKANGKVLQIHDGKKAHPVIGMGTHQKTLAFESRPKSHEALHRAHRPHFLVTRPGAITFKVMTRSPGYIVDKVVLLHQDAGGDEAAPKAIGDLKGTGPAETVYHR